jgi:hypothetical protein
MGGAALGYDACMRMLDVTCCTLLLALAACGTSGTPHAEEAPADAAQCKPGEEKTEDCNSCTCSEEGTWMCTMKLCASCEPGRDQTCNDDPSVSSLWGRCEEGQCVCNDGFAVNPDSGRCRPAGS